jgi:hypothetical protein
MLYFLVVRYLDDKKLFSIESSSLESLTGSIIPEVYIYIYVYTTIPIGFAHFVFFFSNIRSLCTSYLTLQYPIGGDFQSHAQLIPVLFAGVAMTVPILVSFLFF